MDADVEVAEDVVDVASDLLLSCFDDLVEPAQQVVVYVEQELNAPFVLVGKHGLDQLVRLVNDPVVTHLCERDLLGFDEGLHDDDGVLVEAGMVDLVEVCDELQHLLAAAALVWSSCKRGLATCAVSFWGASVN